MLCISHTDGGKQTNKPDHVKKHRRNKYLNAPVTGHYRGPTQEVLYYRNERGLNEDWNKTGSELRRD